MTKITYLELGYNKPVNEETCPDIHIKKCHISTINGFRKKHQNTNVYRSLKLYNTDNEQVIIGPFVVDIDNDRDLNASYVIVKQVLNYLINKGLNANDFRIFFTGHKGFNVEIKPLVLNIHGSVTDQSYLYDKYRCIIVDYLRNLNGVYCSIRNCVDNQETVIDKIHDYIRLHDSINRWISDNGVTISRKKIELTYQGLFSKSINEIITLAEC